MFSLIGNEFFENKAFGHGVYLCNFPLLKITHLLIPVQLSAQYTNNDF